MNENKPEQYSNQLSRKHSRRAKVAAWASSIPGVFGGVVGAEAVFAQPAAAVQEVAPRQSPQAFIDSFDKKLEQRVQLMRSSPYFSSIRHKQLSKAFHTEITISYVGAPSKQYPGRYDWLAVAMRKGESVPLVVEVLVGSPSKTSAERINPKFSYLFGQVDESGKHLPKSMSLLTGGGGDNPPADTYFNVSSEGYPAPLLPKDGVKYSNNPARVSAVYNAFLNQIQSINSRK